MSQKDNEGTFFPNKTQSYTSDRRKGSFENAAEEILQEGCYFRAYCPVKNKKLFFRKKNILKLFLQTVESSFDHTVEILLTNPEKFMLNVQKRSSKHFYSQKKKPISSEKFPLDTGKCFWQNRKFSRSLSKNMSKTFFFQKKNFFWWKISSGLLQCSSDKTVKKLRQRAKIIAINVRKRPETIESLLF